MKGYFLLNKQDIWFWTYITGIYSVVVSPIYSYVNYIIHFLTDWFLRAPMSVHAHTSPNFYMLNDCQLSMWIDFT